MNIADLIAALNAGQDPNQAIVNASMPAAVDPSPARTAEATPGIRPEFMQSGFFPPIPSGGAANAQATGGPPQGASTPVTNPQPVMESPKAMQSPPDLANMYVTLMRNNENARAMDRGLSLIAAGLTPYAANRASLIGLAGQERQGKTMGAADLIAIQKLQQEGRDRLLRQSMLKGLAKQYGLSDETAQYLEASGKLDEVIKHHNTQNLVQGVDAQTGQNAFFNASTGEKIADIGGPKPRETMEVTNETTGEKTLVYKDTGEPVRQLVAPGKPRPTKEVTNEATGEKTLVYADTGEPVRQLVPPTKAGEKLTDDDHILAGINRERAEAGKPPMTKEEYLKKYGKKGVTVNVGPQGQEFPKPPEGQDYERNEDGTVKVFDDGKPRLYSVAGGPAGGKIAETEADVALKQEKVKKAAEGELEKARAKYASVSNVFAAVDKADKIIRESGFEKGTLPAAGFLSSIGGWFGGTPTTNLSAALSTIDANTAFQQLQAMRDASPTGAALGPVSDFENKMLSSTITSLKQAQSPELLRESLRRIRASMTILAEHDFLKEHKGDRRAALQAYENALNAEMIRLENLTAPKGITRTK